MEECRSEFVRDGPASGTRTEEALKADPAHGSVHRRHETLESVHKHKGESQVVFVELHELDSP